MPCQTTNQGLYINQGEYTALRAVFNWVSKVIRVLLWFCFTSLCDWLKPFAPLSRPIRSKTQTNQSRLARARTRFPVLDAGYMYLLRVLIGSLGNLFLLWLAGVITLVLVLRHSFEKRSTVTDHWCKWITAPILNWGQTTVWLLINWWPTERDVTSPICRLQYSRFFFLFRLLREACERRKALTHKARSAHKPHTPVEHTSLTCLFHAHSRPFALRLHISTEQRKKYNCFAVSPLWEHQWITSNLSVALGWV